MGTAGAAEESTSSSPPGLRVLSTALWAGAAALLVDVALFLATAHDPASAWRHELLPRATLAAAGLASALAALAGLCASALWRRSVGRGLPAGILAGILCAQTELVLTRFEAASHALSSAWPSVLLGLALGAAVTLVVASATSARRAPRPRPLAAGVALAVLVLVCALLDVARRPATASERPTHGGHRVPRVILIVADTLRADALADDDAAAGGAAADSARATPNLDAFAADAWRFTAARSAAPWTLPSMCTLLTGLSPLVHGALQRSSVLPDAAPTLAEAFAAAGYRTAAIGHNPVLSRTRRLDRGFDEYDIPSASGVPGRSLGFALLRRGIERAGERYGEAGELVERASSWVEQHAAQDFFLWMHFYDPHLAYAPPAAFRPAGAAPAGFGPTVGFGELERLRGGYLVPDAEGRRWVRALYDGEVRFLDERLGAFFDRLRELGLYEDSLIVFTSDHGEEFWEHQGFEHGHSSYEELLRVPLLVKLPAGRPGGRDDRPVPQESIAPSLLTLCGIDFDAARRSAPSLFRADGELAAAGPGQALSTGTLYFEDRLALWFEGWKYVRHVVSGREELYDLTRDPDERVPLQHTESERLAEARRRVLEQAERAEELRAALGVEHSGTGLEDAELEALRRIGYAQR